MENNKYDSIVASIDRYYESYHKLHMKVYKWRCNAWWIASFIFVLVALLVSFVLIKLDCDTLVGAITNFSTILSIILSISSIAYSYTTSHDTARQFAEIDKIVAKMRENNEDMKNNNSQMLGFVINISKEVHALHERNGAPANSRINNNEEFTGLNVNPNIVQNDTKPTIE